MDNKIKKAADKIRMPDDMKERIISACQESAEKNITQKKHNDDFTEVVSGTERVSSRGRMIRMVSALAACAVLAGGIGATGALLHKHSRSQFANSELSQSAQAVSPFGDFSTFEFRFDAGDGKYGQYSTEIYARLADCLNRVDWGDELEEYETRTADQDVEGQTYDIKWTMGDTPPVSCDLHIANDGFVTYSESMMDETGAQKIIIENSRCYKIDFDTFSADVLEILAQDVETISPFGDFSTLDYSFYVGDDNFGVYSDEGYAKLSDFLNYFSWGESVEREDGSDNTADADGQIYGIKWTIGDTSPVVCNVHIFNDGYALYDERKMNFDTGELDPVDKIKWYKIDFDAFDTGVKEIISGENISVPEDSPFAKVITKEYWVSPFVAGLCDITREQRGKVASLFLSQTWREIDDTGEFGDMILIPDGESFVAEYREDDEYYQLTVLENEHACVFTATYDGDGNVITSDKKFYTCDNADFDIMLEEIFNESAGEESMDYNSEEQMKSDHKLVVDLVDRLGEGLVVWCEDGGWNKKELDSDQFETVRNYFNNHEFNESVANTFGKVEYRRWNEEFGESQIQLNDINSDESAIIYVSKDSSLIAVVKPASTEYIVNIYKADGLEALQFIREFEK